MGEVDGVKEEVGKRGGYLELGGCLSEVFEMCCALDLGSSSGLQH